MKNGEKLNSLYDFRVDIYNEYGFDANESQSKLSNKIINRIVKLSNMNNLSLGNISKLTVNLYHADFISAFFPYSENLNFTGGPIDNLFNYPVEKGADGIDVISEKSRIKNHVGFKRIYEQFAGENSLTKEEAHNSMVSYLSQTKEKVNKYFSKNWDSNTSAELAALFGSYKKWFVFQNSFGTVSADKSDDASVDWRLNQIYTYWENKARTGREAACEMFARLILTVSMFYLLHPAKDKSNEYLFKNRVKCYYDPSLALNVLWTYDFEAKQFFYLQKNIIGNSAVNNEEAVISKLIEADGYYDRKEYNLLINLLSDEFSNPTMLSSDYELEGTRKLITSVTELTAKGIYASDKSINLHSVIDKYSAECPGEGNYYMFRYLFFVEKNIDSALGYLLSSCKNLYEPAIYCLLDTVEGKDFPVLKTAENYSEGRCAEICLNAVRTNGIKDRELLKRLYFFLGNESSSASDREKYLKLAGQYGHSEAEEMLNRRRHAEKRCKSDKKAHADFCFVNSRNSCTDIFVNSLECGNVITADKDPEYSDFENYKRKLEMSDACSLAAVLFDEDENKNIADAIKIIRILSEINDETDEIKKEKRLVIRELCDKLREIKSAERDTDKKGGKKGTETGDKTVSFIRIIDSENYALGQFGFVNSLRSENDSDELKEIFDKLEEAFALPDFTVKLMNGIRIFIRTDNPEYASSIIDTEMGFLSDGLYFKVNYIDTAKAAAHNLLTDIPLFAPSYYQNPEDTAHLVIFGSSGVAEKLITETLACTYMGNAFCPTITVVDEDTRKIEEKIIGGCPALEDREITGIPEPEFFSISLNSPELLKTLSGNGNEKQPKLAFNLKRGNFFAVATDDEKFNISFAARLRGLLLMTDNRFTRLPVIAVYTPSRYGELACENFEVGNQKGYSWYNNYNLVSFGRTDECYSADRLLNNPIQAMTEKIHSVYSTVDETVLSGNVLETAKKEVRKSLYTNYYNYDSSNCSAISLPYRLFADGIKLDDIYDYSQKDAADTLASLSEKYCYEENLEKIAMLEHQRWCGFMISRAWRKASIEMYSAYMGRGVNRQQLFICKLHPYLCSWDNLEKTHESLLKRLSGNSYALSKLRNNPKNIDCDSIRNTANFLRAGSEKLTETD